MCACAWESGREKRVKRREEGRVGVEMEVEGKVEVEGRR